ncbi:ABC transporter [Prosthecochloris marina]|uniref:ABC transporter n=1 Tax=Prosthecochloris marina TaxID=2017681 RepID=A0A317T8Q5_9CHLB|nr:ATP-binding cassette domain-containing protein [Prosthecochloris marina]PWW83093.1 ABC transporter [Prosthecochloris marina]
MPILLEIESLGFSYENAFSPVFSELNLSVGQEEFIVVKGASGTGKSTLLRLICRLQAYDEGHILFKRRSIESYKPAELRRSIIYVAQIPSMIDASVRENLLFPFSFAVNGSMAEPADARLTEMLEQFYLQDVSLLQQARNLSVGQQQRIALMRALLLDPEILLLDEPTSALDAKSASMVFSIVEHLNTRQGKTIIMVTHSNRSLSTISPVEYLLEQSKLRKI